VFGKYQTICWTLHCTVKYIQLRIIDTLSAEVEVFHWHVCHQNNYTATRTILVQFWREMPYCHQFNRTPSMADFLCVYAQQQDQPGWLTRLRWPHQLRGTWSHQKWANRPFSRVSHRMETIGELLCRAWWCIKNTMKQLRLESFEEREINKVNLYKSPQRHLRDQIRGGNSFWNRSRSKVPGCCCSRNTRNPQPGSLLQ
jgi:hypothetical protein